MIFNAYAVLDAFLSLLRLPLGLAVVGLAGAAWWSSRRPLAPDDLRRWEDRSYLIVLLAMLAFALNLAAWPLFYALLQSYIPQWPGVMCIYGVLQIGRGSEGASAYLPSVLAWLQGTKAAVVFLSGAWFVLYVLHRLAPTLPLMRRVLLLLMVFGAATMLDAALEGAYLTIPKKEHFLSVGCCTPVLDAASRGGRFVPARFDDPHAQRRLAAAYYGVNGGLVVLLGGYLASRKRLSANWVLAPAMLGAIAATPISGLFLVEIAAPGMLGLPYHHCAYDLLPRAPEGIAGIALYALGCFGVGWAAIVQWCGQAAGQAEPRRLVVDRLLFLAMCGFAASLAFFRVALWVAERRP